MAIDEVLRKCVGFDWDEGNILKNWKRHRVSASECEQVFFNRPLVSFPDEVHSSHKPRFYALSRTDAGRYIFVAFAERNNLIRVISARDMSRKERKAFEIYEKNSEIQNRE